MVFDKRYFIGFFISVIFIGIMAAVSDLIGVTEVIFPEAAALLFGSFIMIRMPWNVRHVTMTAEMTACAAAGLIISRYADMPIYFKMLLAAAIVFVMLTVGGNTLTPSVSACVLPVLVGTKDWIYIASVFVIAAVCDIGSFIIEKRDTKESRRRFERRKDMLLLWSRMFAVLAVILLIPGISGELYLTAPPLIVAYIALSGPGMAGRGSANPPITTFIVFFLTSSAGYLCRLLGDNSPVPVAVCVMAAAATAWIIITVSGHFFPPAAALAVLPFILPAEGLWKYPVEVTAGIVIYYAGAMFAAWLMKRRGADTEPQD